MMELEVINIELWALYDRAAHPVNADDRFVKLAVMDRILATKKLTYNLAGLSQPENLKQLK